MSDAFLLISLGYILLLLALVFCEGVRTRGGSPDAITVFVAIFALECCIPGVGIFSLLPFADPGELSGNSIFDRIYLNASFSSAALLLAMSFGFVFFFYMGVGGVCWIRRSRSSSDMASSRLLVGSEYRLGAVLMLGLGLTLLSFYFLGADMVERFGNLIKLRAYAEDVERTELSAYGIALTQAWGWLSVPALFVVGEKRGSRLRWIIALVFLILFAVLGVSRRALFVPVMLCYFTLVLRDGRWRLKGIAILAIPIVIWVIYGKELFATIAFGGEAEALVGRYDSPVSALLRASSEQGITLVESLGTFTYLDEHLRLGIDHLLSIAQRFPFRWFGVDVEFPKRMVRISTEAFASSDAQDIPPGLFGQMWLDFRIVGPAIWGLLIGVQVAIAQWAFSRWNRTAAGCALIVLVVFLIALPVNTGSYDFTLSIDVIVTVAVLFYSFRESHLKTGGPMRAEA